MDRIRRRGNNQREGIFSLVYPVEMMCVSCLKGAPGEPGTKGDKVTLSDALFVYSVREFIWICASYLNILSCIPCIFPN